MFERYYLHNKKYSSLFLDKDSTTLLGTDHVDIYHLTWDETLYVSTRRIP